MLVVATYFWSDKATRQKFEYKADDVRALRRRVAEHLTTPHEFAVITDRPHMFDGDDFRAIPMDKTTHVPGTCFARLFTFHPQGQSLIGERVLQIDLDTLIVGDMAPLVERDEDLVMWRNPSRVPWNTPDPRGRPYYNTSMVLHRCGTMPQLWSEFNRHVTPGKYRDDQWYLSSMLGPDTPYWDGGHGVYRLGRPDTPGSGVAGDLPANARVVTFPGSEGKWWESHIMAANPWIERYATA
jgi:hypothetical protein